MVLSNLAPWRGVLSYVDLLFSTPSDNQAIKNSDSQPGTDIFSLLREDRVELSSEAETHLMEIRNPDLDAMARIRSFAAEFSGSFRSQTIAQWNQLTENGNNRGFAFLNTQFDFKISIKSLSVSESSEEISLSSAGMKDFKNYLILIKTFLEKLREQMNEIFDLQGEGGGFIDIEKFTEMVNDLASDLEEFLTNSALGESTPGGVALALNYFEINIDISISNTTVVQTEQVQSGDPLVLDLDGDGLELTSLTDGVLFDLDGNGILDIMAFVAGGDAFLALDRNDNGKIDSGKELFGDHYGASNGLEELKKFDENRDNLINIQDSVYQDLLLFSDLNGNGLGESHEYKPLKDSGIESISLNYENVNHTINDNQVAQQFYFNRTDGTTGIAADTFLRYISFGVA